MYRIKIKLTFIYCRDGDLVTLTRRFLDSLKDNPNFQTPTPALADIEKALNDYILALTNAAGRDREMVSIKNDKKAILQQLLKALAQYVIQTCKGDKTMLISSGFDITRERSKPQQLPLKLVVEMESPGQAICRVKKVTGARAYIHQYTADPLTTDSAWISETSLINAHTFTGLKSGSKIWLRVIAITSAGNRVNWEPVSRIIQ